MNESEYTTCPYCTDAMPPRRKQCGKPECKKAFHAERARQFHADYRERTGSGYVAPSRLAGNDYSNIYEHTCEWCGRVSMTHKQEQRYCSPEHYRLAQAEAKRSGLLPILHPNPAPRTLLPVNHPVVLMQQTQTRRLFIANVCTVCSEGFITAYVRHATCGRDLCVAEKRRAERHNRRTIDRAFTRGRQPGCFSVNEWGRRLIEYGRCCAYCGDAAELEIEHVFPSCRGGSNLIANIVPACRDCNQDKHVMTPDEWLLSGSKRVARLDASAWPAGKWGPGKPLSLEEFSLKCNWSQQQPLPV